MIVIFNAGSSSFKWKLFDSKLNELESSEEETIFPRLEKMNVDFVGHRYVHGGSLRKSQKVDRNTIFELESVINLAPLHNKKALEVLRKSLRSNPQIPNYVVFDSEFFLNLPDFAKIYAIPYKFFEEGIYKYGFHGISHEYAFLEGCRELDLNPKKSKIITIHLGAGCSMTAILNGTAVDTSMGFTPNEGLVMATRSGDIDTGLINILHQNYHLSIVQIDDLINNKSGWKGLTGTEDFLKVLTNLTNGETEEKQRSLLTLEIMAYKIKKYIGSYAAVLGGVDAIIFTGVIGYSKEAKTLRQMSLSNLNFLGHFKVLEIEPNEELAIARKIINYY